MHIAQKFISIYTYINAKYNISRHTLNLTCHGISFKFRVRIRLPGKFKSTTATFMRSDKSRRLKVMKDFQLKQVNLNLKQLSQVALNDIFDKQKNSNKYSTRSFLDLLNYHINLQKANPQGCPLLSSLSKLKFIKTIKDKETNWQDNIKLITHIYKR